jgi:hypothetical protein
MIHVAAAADFEMPVFFLWVMQFSIFRKLFDFQSLLCGIFTLDDCKLICGAYRWLNER